MTTTPSGNANTGSVVIWRNVSIVLAGIAGVLWLASMFSSVSVLGVNCGSTMHHRELMNDSMEILCADALDGHAKQTGMLFILTFALLAVAFTINRTLRRQTQAG